MRHLLLILARPQTVITASGTTTLRLLLARRPPNYRPAPCSLPTTLRLLLARRVATTPAVANPFDFDLSVYLTGAIPGVPIYPGHIPEGAGTGPAISYFTVSEEPYYTLARAAGLTARVYQFSTWSTSYLTSSAIERSLRAVLHGYRGYMGSTFVSSCRIQQCLDLPYEPNVDGSDEGTFQRAVEYRIAFKESIPNLY